MAQKKIKNRDIEKGKEPKGLPISPIPRPLNIENYPILSKMFEHMDGGIFEVFRHYLDPSKKGFKQIQLDRMRGILTDEDPRAPINAEGASEQEILERERLLQDVDKYRDKKIYTAKGGSIPQQMELFSEGGLKDEGNTVHPISGNEVPPGSLQEEVRDDVPAQLSEGEFVFPADVVRYIGLEKLMMMRQEAKAGLARMEEMGQMGNSEEATLPDDIPFEMADLDTRDETEEDVLQANVGAFVPPKLPTNQPYNPNVNPYMPTGNVTTPYMPYQPGQSQQILKPAGGGTGQVETEMRRYVNKETGQVRMIPFNKATGTSLYPIDALLNQGFVREDEKPKEVAKTAKVATTKIKPVEQDSGDDGPPPSGAVDLTGNPFSYKSIFNMDEFDTAMKNLSYMQTDLFNPYKALGRGVTGKINANNAILSASKMQLEAIRVNMANNIRESYGITLPTNFDIGKLSTYGQGKKLTAEEEKRIRKYYGNELAKHTEVIKAAITNPSTGEIYTNKDFKDVLNKYNVKTTEIKKGTNITVKRNIGAIVRDLAEKKQEEVERFQTDTGVRDKTDKASIEAAKAVRENEKLAASGYWEDPSNFESQSSDSSDPYGEGLSDADIAGETGVNIDEYNKGGLASKKKPKVKRMKKGGLASKK